MEIEPEDNLWARRLSRSSNGPTYNLWHHEMHVRYRDAFRGVFPDLDQLCAFVEANKPLTLEASRSFTEELFNDPSLIERGDALPERGRDLFIYASIHEFKRRNPHANLAFENLFESVTNAQVSIAIVRLTGDPRYVTRNGTPAELEQFWAPILEHSPAAYRYLPRAQRASLALTRQVCRLVPSLYQYATGAAKDEFELARDVCRQDGLLLGYCNDVLAGDHRVVSAALGQNRAAALYISGDFLRRSEQFLKVQNLLEMVHLSPAALQHDQVLLNFIVAGLWDEDTVEVELELGLCRHLIHAQGDVLEACAAYFHEDPELARVTRDIVALDEYEPVPLGND